MENDNYEKVYFTASVDYSEAMFKEILYASSRRFNIVYLLLSLVSILTCVSSIVFDKDIKILALCALFMAVLLVTVNIKFNKQPKLQYNQYATQIGSHDTVVNIKFGESIKVKRHGADEVEHFYATVNRFIETKNYFVIVLNHNVILPIDKSQIKTNRDYVFKEFILSKCYCLKTNKCIKRKKEQKLFKFVNYISWIAIIFVILTSLYHATPADWRDRTIDYSSTPSITYSDIVNS